MKKLITTCAFLLFVTSIFAQISFTVDGIYYCTTSANTVEVMEQTPDYTGSITIPSTVVYSAVTYNVTSIENYAFSYCYRLTSVTIPSSVTSIVSESFQGDTALTSVTIPSSVISIGDGAFEFCSGLTSITIPSSVTSIGDYEFCGCTNLTSVTIPNSVTSIGVATFEGCTGLTSVIIPSSVTSIGNCEFYGCSSLTSVAIPSSVTSIESAAFHSCTGLTSITIPSSVTSIHWGAFEGCTGLTSIYAYPTTPVDLTSSSFVFHYVNTTSCKLYVPTGSLALYQAANQWQDFANIVGVTTAVPTINDANYRFYLNPLDDAISITGLKGTLRLFDMNGRLLLTKQITGNESVSIASLPQGLYIAKLLTAQGMVERKVLKK